MSETETPRFVATRANGGNNNNKVYHTDPECRLLHGSETRPVRDVEVQNKGLHECAACRGASDLASQPERTCPFCEDTVSLLPHHLRHNCDGVDA